MLSNNFNSSKRLTYENLTDTNFRDELTFFIDYSIVIDEVNKLVDDKD